MGGDNRRDRQIPPTGNNGDPLSTQTVKVLAALARRPFGIRHVTEVGRASGVPRSTAGRILRQLQKEGMARQDRRILMDWGRAREGTVWTLRLSPTVLRLLPSLSQVDLPDPWLNREPPTRVPSRFWHHFWNATPAKLTLPEDSHYVADRLLLSSDPTAWAWALNSLPVSSLTKVARSRGADRRTKALIMNFVSARI